VDIDQIAHAPGEVICRSAFGDFNRAPATVCIEENEQIGGAVALVFAVVAQGFARLGRNRLSYLADELGWTFIEAHHRVLRVGDFGIQVEHVFHACNVLRVADGFLRGSLLRLPGFRMNQNSLPLPGERSTCTSFTDKQGQYLAFIWAYSLINGRAPAEHDISVFSPSRLLPSIKWCSTSNAMD